MRLLCLMLCCSGLLIPQPLAAQAIQAVGERDLAFGTLFPGIPEQVLRTDAGRAGRYRVRAQAGTGLSVRFVLPAAMVGPGAATLPMGFAADDGGYAPLFFLNFQIPLDPNSPYNFSMPFLGTVRFYLGGTASPSFAQTGGNYSAAIVMIVAVVSN